MDGKTIEYIVARKQYSHGLTVSPHKLLITKKEKKKGSFTIQRPGRHGLNQITRVSIIKHGTTSNMCFPKVK